MNRESLSYLSADFIAACKEILTNDFYLVGPSYIMRRDWADFMRQVWAGSLSLANLVIPREFVLVALT